MTGQTLTPAFPPGSVWLPSVSPPAPPSVSNIHPTPHYLLHFQVPPACHPQTHCSASRPSDVQGNNQMPAENLTWFPHSWLV